MAPRYIDWNGNGRIDPADVGVSHAVGDDETEEAGHPNRGGPAHRPGVGCLVALICVIGVTSLLALVAGTLL